MENLRDRRRTGRPRPGTDRYAAWIHTAAGEQNPEPCLGEFAWRTAQRGHQALGEKFGSVLSVSPGYRGLRRLSLPPQRSQRRATRFEPAHGQRGKDPELPQLARQAQERGALRTCAAESGRAAQSGSGRPGGSRRQPPGRVASSPDGQLYCMVREGPATAEVFREFLEKIAEEAGRKILFVVANCRIHRARIIQEWLAANQAAIDLYVQPAYSPPVNPVERLGSLVQRRVSRELSKTAAQLWANLEAACQSLPGAPEQVQAFFREADRKYILA